MIIPDKKKMATMIVADLKGAPEMDMPEDGGELEALASEILAAVDSGSTQGLADALKAFFMACEAREHEEEAEEEI